MTTWIFQGNPQKFDIDGYLAANRDIRWLVTRYAERIREGKSSKGFALAGGAGMLPYQEADCGPRGGVKRRACQ